MAAILCLSALAPMLLGATSSAATTWDPGTGLSTNYDFAQLVLRDGGWPVSPSNVTVLTQWLRAEEPTAHWWDRDNPLNNGLGSGGGSGLGSYDSVVVAAFDVARNLSNPAYGYPLVVRDLATSAPAATTAWAIWRSSWASGHYGWGADWATSPVPSVAAPPTAWQSPTRCPIGYPLQVVGPCGRGFSATGPSWRAGAPGGLEREEQWAFAGNATAPDVATWAPSLTPGPYAVAAFVPTGFSDAVVTYVVTDATGVHRVRVDQEPYADAWVPLGSFQAGAGAITVALSTATAGPRDAYVAADAVRFVPLGGLARGPGTAQRRPARVRPPGPALDVSAVAGSGAATVTWLPPSKDGGAALQRFTAVAVPSGRSCRAGTRVSGSASCEVRGLRDGTAYRFVVRAQSRAGLGAISAPSAPVVPVGVPTLHARLVARALAFGQRLVVRVVVTPVPTSGTVLFAEDGAVLKGCQLARVAHGRAACSTRLEAAGRHQLLLTYSGSASLSGGELTVPLAVAPLPTALRAVASPADVAQGAVLTLHGLHLPGRATGRVVFSAGPARLCVGEVRSGGATCTARATLAVGHHLVTATYLGSRDDHESVAHVAIEVLPPTPPGAPSGRGR